MKETAADVDTYIAGFPEAVQKQLQQVRKAIKQAAPGAEEAIKYGIPTFILNGNLVHFGGYARHLGFYPAPSINKLFEKEIENYKRGKGSIQFPLNEPMPLDLITRIVQFRVKENMAKKAKTPTAHWPLHKT